MAEKKIWLVGYWSLQTDEYLFNVYFDTVDEAKSFVEERIKKCMEENDAKGTWSWSKECYNEDQAKRYLYCCDDQWYGFEYSVYGVDVDQ